MAQTATIIPGLRYRIISGMLEGMVVTVVDTYTFPDSDPLGRQRKLTIRFSDEDNSIGYILPRLLDGPIGEPSEWEKLCAILKVATQQVEAALEASKS